VLCAGFFVVVRSPVHSSFVIQVSFDIRISSFVIAAMPYLLACALLTIGPADELRAALDDLATLPVHERSGARYASFYAQPEERRGEAAAVLSFVLNTVSQSAIIVDLEEVAGAQKRLWRVRWDRYGHSRDDWERLASEDPYWHQRLTVKQGKQRGAKDVFIDGPWLPADLAAQLRTESGSAGAVLRGDFLIARISTTLDGGHYYRLARIAETEGAFLRELGIDAKAIGKLSADAGANLIYSRVTHQVRRIVRRPGPLGGAWHTYDVESSTAERDPLRNPFAFQFDAGEHIAAGPNGLHRFALFDARGKRQDSVPDRIAKDTTDPHGVGIIAPMISCVLCLVEDGLRPFANDQQRLLGGDVDLLTARPRDAERLADFYGADLERWLLRDREDYAAQVARAARGLSVRPTAVALGRIYSVYVDDLVTTDQAAREVGMETAAFIAAARKSNDPALLALAEGIAIQREQWIASFAPAAMLTVARADASPSTSK
jgi:hypothetical protein